MLNLFINQTIMSINTSSERGRRLRERIDSDKTVFLPGVHDALSAKLAADHLEVHALLHSGYGTSASLNGLPDMNFTSLEETLDVVSNMARAAGDTPIVVDADTGYGGIANLKHTVPEIERAGAAGIFIEDQIFPKTCGLMEGVETIDTNEMVHKIEAAIDARQNDEFVIMGRTDVYAEADLDEVISRGNAYAEAGADVFYLAEPMPVDDYETICSEVPLPVFALMIHTSGYDYPTVYPLEAYQEAGVDLVSDVGVCLQTAVYHMQSYLNEMMETRDNRQREMIPMDELTELLGASEYEQFEDKHSN
jgi:2-methylisocitrate lyase-like PEP mutase family enzyme